MIASVTSIEIKAKQINEAIDVYERLVIPERKALNGSSGGFLLIDRSSGKGFAVTLWDTDDDYQEYLVIERTDNYREKLQKFKDYFVSNPIGLGQYEVCTNG